MGLKNSETTKTTYVKMFSKEPGTDNVNAFFGMSEKVDGSWKTTQRFDTVEGVLTAISVGEFVYQNDTKKTLKMVFTDESGERVQVESTFTFLAYNVINTLYGCDITKPLRIKLYVRRGDKESPAAYMECGGERASWAFEPSQLPKAARVTVGKKEVIDDTEVVEFYERLVNEIATRLSKSPKPVITTAAAVQEEQPVKGDDAIASLAAMKRIEEQAADDARILKNSKPKTYEKPVKAIEPEDDLPF
jgi:hypothetical protein